MANLGLITVACLRNRSHTPLARVLTASSRALDLEMNDAGARLRNMAASSPSSSAPWSLPSLGTRSSFVLSGGEASPAFRPPAAASVCVERSRREIGELLLC